MIKDIVFKHALPIQFLAPRRVCFVLNPIQRTCYNDIKVNFQTKDQGEMHIVEMSKNPTSS